MAVTPITQEEFDRIKVMLYHIVSTETQAEMQELRVMYLDLALSIIREQDKSRSQSLALTQLEESLMRAIQGLALKGTPTLPPYFEVVS